MKVIFEPNSTPLADSERERRVAEPGFGKYYTDNMVVANWSESSGWQDAQLKAYGPLTLDPATMVFHYGQEVFEGMKAYSQADGGISLFRPDANAKRFAKSAARIALPEMPVDFFVQTVEALVKQDQKWVPKKVGESLYLRPFLIATEVGLGVRPANHATYVLIATPGRSFHAEYVKSLIETTRELNKRGITYGFLNKYSSFAPSARELTATDSNVHNWHTRTIGGGKYTYRKIFWIDSDIEWTPEQFMKIYDSDLDIISGLYQTDVVGTVAVNFPDPNGRPTKVKTVFFIIDFFFLGFDQKVSQFESFFGFTEFTGQILPGLGMGQLGVKGELLGSQLLLDPARTDFGCCSKIKRCHELETDHIHGVIGGEGSLHGTAFHCSNSVIGQ